MSFSNFGEFASPTLASPAWEYVLFRSELFQLWRLRFCLPRLSGLGIRTIPQAEASPTCRLASPDQASSLETGSSVVSSSTLIRLETGLFVVELLQLWRLASPTKLLSLKQSFRSELLQLWRLASPTKSLPFGNRLFHSELLQLWRLASPTKPFPLGNRLFRRELLQLCKLASPTKPLP
ncbi:hypothetical protein Adt_25177 [Abeliophyllum distichum]|uniref:Uncharacterized protein n=1 Tax=Abeliophyllum distichum TaxID=126358 RepID=A0ABD1SIW5_9LAMI